MVRFPPVPPLGYHGKAYYQMKSSYDYGLSKIYELVINNNPAYAFLLETNTLLHNKFVVAHVLGHTDFFKNNIWFEPTNRQMVESVSQNATRIRQYGLEEGSVVVEKFLDAVLALEDHVDPYPRKVAAEAGEKSGAAGGLYDDLFEEAVTSDPLGPRPKGKRRIPPEPEQDLLRFLLEHGDQLEEWQKDVIAIVREESLYFVPQMMTNGLIGTNRRVQTPSQSAAHRQPHETDRAKRRRTITMPASQAQTALIVRLGGITLTGDTYAAGHAAKVSPGRVCSLHRTRVWIFARNPPRIYPNSLSKTI